MRAENYEALHKAVMQYLTLLNSDIPLADPEFKMLKGRIITLACKLVTEREDR